MIRVQNLVKTFGTFTAVNDVSFEVAEGEIFAFLGPNGAGKTTTIKMLTTLLKPTSGAIELDGLDPQAKQNEARKRFGIVFQDPSLDGDLTAEENMEIHGVLYHVPHKMRGSAEELLKLFELWERRKDQVKKFSGGMKRRLEIARGFLHTPKILFLDEPTLGLDPQSRNQLWTHVKKVNEAEKVTVFLTTHYMDEADRVAHRVGVIDHGKLVAQGTPQAIKEQTGDGNAGRCVSQVDGLDHPRRERRIGRPVAAIRQDVERRQAMNAIYILWLRELKRYTRSRAQIVASLGQPLLYLLVLGFGLGPVFKRAGNGNYFQFVAPGVIGMSVLFLVDLFRTGPALGPPVRISEGDAGGAGAAHPNHDRPHAGRCTVAVIQGFLVTVVCVIAGFRPAHLTPFPWRWIHGAHRSAFAALGVAIGSGLQDMQGFQLIMNFLVMPIYFLSGAMFPLNDAHNVLKYITRADPLSYGIDGMRIVLGGTNAAFSPQTDLLVLVCVGAILLVFGAWRFSKIEI